MVYTSKETRNAKDRERRLKAKLNNSSTKNIQPIKLAKPKPEAHEDIYSDSDIEPENVPESSVKPVPMFAFYH